jgi:hypothetical protein
MALRLTGSPQNRDEPWFQILDPTGPTLIPKVKYGRIRPGWRTCVPETRLTVAWGRRSEVQAATRRADADILQFLAGDPAVVVSAGGALLLAMLVASRVAYTRRNRRQATMRTLQTFGERFVAEFERPLRQPGVEERPLRVRMRLAPRRQRLEILLAPNGGRTYPNLTDHRRNLAYDVARVLRVLADPRFTGGEMYAQGRWVVVPCRLNNEPEREGGR